MGKDRLSFSTLDDETFREFNRLWKYYWREANKCEESKSYLAGCTMLGSSLETMLFLMVDLYPDEAESTGKIPKKNGKIKPFLAWNLGELLRVAKAAGWLSSALDLEDEWDFKKAKIGDYAEIVRMVRNLSHPARYSQDHFGKRITKKYFDRLYEIVDACRKWLLQHVETSILVDIKDKNLEKS